MAFRMSWISQDATYLQGIWSQIVFLREKLDELLKTIPGMQCYFSALTATAVLRKKYHDPKSKYSIYPGVAYWLLAQDETFNERLLYNQMQTNPIGATMKLILQPYQKDGKSIANALCSVVKDNIDGMVRRTVDSYMEPLSCPYPIVKVSLWNKHSGSVLHEVSSDLAAARFHMDIEMQD